ncbi:MAG: NAD(+)/NADH kinase, partial [Caulobacteraceae bacterium]
MSGPLPLPTRLAFVASDRPEAIEARARLVARYGEVSEEQAQVVVALGGDGFMLEVLHRNLAARRPIYGMNLGSVGFL